MRSIASSGLISIFIYFLEMFYHRVNASENVNDKIKERHNTFDQTIVKRVDNFWRNNAAKYVNAAAE